MGGRFFYVQSYPYAQHPAGTMHGIPTPQGFMPMSNEHYMMHPMSPLHHIPSSGAPSLPPSQYYPRSSQSSNAPAPSRGPATKIKISHPDTLEEVNVNDLAKEALLDRHSLPPPPPVESEAAALAKSQVQQSSCKKTLIIKRPLDMPEDEEVPGPATSVASDTSEPSSRSSSRLSDVSSTENRHSTIDEEETEMQMDHDEQNVLAEQPMESMEGQDVTEPPTPMALAPSTPVVEEEKEKEEDILLEMIEDVPMEPDLPQDPLSCSGQASELPIPDIVVQDLSEPSTEQMYYPTYVPAFCDILPEMEEKMQEVDAAPTLVADPTNDLLGDANVTFNNEDTYVESVYSQKQPSPVYAVETDMDTTSHHSNMTTPPLDVVLESPSFDSVEPPTTEVEVRTVVSSDPPSLIRGKHEASSSPRRPSPSSRFPKQSANKPTPVVPATSSLSSSAPPAAEKKKKPTDPLPKEKERHGVVRYTPEELLKLKAMVEKQNRPFALPQALSSIRLKDSRTSGTPPPHYAAAYGGDLGYTNGQMKGGRPLYQAMRDVSSHYPSHPGRGGPLTLSKPSGNLMQLAFAGKDSGHTSVHQLPSKFAHYQHSQPMPQSQTFLSSGVGMGARAPFQQGRGRGSMQTYPLPSHPSAFPPKPLENADPNRWVPGFLKRDESDLTLTEEEKYLKTLERSTRGLLNKISPENFDTLQDFFFQAEKYFSAIKLKTDMIVRKSFDEPKYASLYAKLTLSMVMRTRPLEGTQPSDDIEKAFEHIRKQVRNSVIKACENQFKARPMWAYKMHPKMTEEDYEEITKLKGKVLGNMRFVAELFNFDVLSPKVMSNIVNALLHDIEAPKEEDLECVIVLLNTAGPLLERTEKMADFEAWFRKINHIIRANSTIPRIRFLLMDLVALKENNWVKPDGSQLAQQLKDLNITNDSTFSKSKPAPSPTRSSSSKPAPPSKSASSGKRTTSPDSTSKQQGWMQSGKSGSSSSSSTTTTTSSSSSSSSTSSSSTSSSSSPSTTTSSSSQRGGGGGASRKDQQGHRSSTSSSSAPTSSRKGGRNDNSSASNSNRHKVSNKFSIFDESSESPPVSKHKVEESASEPEPSAHAVESPLPPLPPVASTTPSGSTSVKDISVDDVKAELSAFIRSRDPTRLVSVLHHASASFATDSALQSSLIITMFEYLSELTPSLAPMYGEFLVTVLHQQIWTPDLFVKTLAEDEGFVEAFQEFKIDCPQLPSIMDVIFRTLQPVLKSPLLELLKKNYSVV